MKTMPTCAQEYHQSEGEASHVVNTGWALLALLAAKYHEIDAAPCHAAARCLILDQARVSEVKREWEVHAPAE